MGAWPLGEARCLVVILWDTVPSPFSRHAGTTGAELMSESPRLPEKMQPAWFQRAVWLFMLGFICAASVWALIWISCAFDPGEWGPRGSDVIWALTMGLAPLFVALLLVYLLWTRMGPPFPRRRTNP